MWRGAVGPIAAAAWIASIAACSESAAPPREATESVALANPAAEHCVEQGGRHVIEAAPTGDEFGVCYFEDNRQCEAWALLQSRRNPRDGLCDGRGAVLRDHGRAL
jgi:putative hemolysin